VTLHCGLTEGKKALAICPCYAFQCQPSQKSRRQNCQSTNASLPLGRCLLYRGVNSCIAKIDVASLRIQLRKALPVTLVVLSGLPAPAATLFAKLPTGNGRGPVVWLASGSKFRVRSNEPLSGVAPNIEGLNSRVQEFFTRSVRDKWEGAECDERFGDFDQRKQIARTALSIRRRQERCRR